jgi:hypothetical protein
LEVVRGVGEDGFDGQARDDLVIEEMAEVDLLAIAAILADRVDRLCSHR